MLLGLKTLILAILFIIGGLITHHTNKTTKFIPTKIVLILREWWAFIFAAILIILSIIFLFKGY